MSIYFIFHWKFPSERAQSLCTAKSCEAFADHGEKVTLLAPRRIGRSRVPFSEYYKMKNNFNVVYLPTIDLFWMPVVKEIAFYISLISFSISCFFYALFKPKRDSIYYSNESLPLLFISYISGKTFYEMHDYPEKKRWFYRIMLKRLWKMLITNTWKLERVKKEYGIPEEKMIYEPNAVEIGEFEIKQTKEECRKQLNLPADKTIALYTGHLYGWKGVDTLAQAAPLLPENIVVVFVGGTPQHVEQFKKTYGHNKNILIIGQRPHAEIPLWQKAADMFILPNTAKETISYYYTSPMKSFEYMAGRRPIIASRLPSISQIMDDSSAFLFEPDNSRSLAETVKFVTNNQHIAEEKAEKAYLDVQRHSWYLRARRILDFVYHDGSN